MPVFKIIDRGPEIYLKVINVLSPGREEDDIQAHLLKVLREEQETASSRLLTWAKVSVTDNLFEFM